MQLRPFGQTGLSTSPLGLGAGSLGDAAMDERDAADLIAAALDGGITCFDTARSYGASEERLGRYLQPHRSRVLLSTKLGYGIPGVPDWTAEAVRLGVEDALRRLQTDVIDVVHLHSCPLETLLHSDVIPALLQARQDGKVRAVAYSGENEPLAWAIRSGHFDAVQTSLNLCDQRDIDTLMVEAAAQGLGRIAKRPLANAPWRFAHQPHGHYAEAYWLRWRAMDLPRDLPPEHLALRFAAFHANADVAIVGTANTQHLRHNLAILAEGPLPEDTARALRDAFQRADTDWSGLV